MLQTLIISSLPNHLAGAIRSDLRAAPAPAARVPESLYEVLRVKRDASSREIKTAYRTLAKIYHPDSVASAAACLEKSEDDGRVFIEIHNAYATLSDPASRAVYDRELTACKIRNRSGSYPTRRWETDQCW